jgi:hypothetical protein
MRISQLLAAGTMSRPLDWAAHISVKRRDAVVLMLVLCTAAGFEAGNRMSDSTGIGWQLVEPDDAWVPVLASQQVPRGSRCHDHSDTSYKLQRSSGMPMQQPNS